MDHVLFLTGRLAEPSLRRVLGSIDTATGTAPFTWAVHELGVQVAALMTTDMVARRLPRPVQAHRVVLPGRCRGDIDALSTALGVPVLRGPEEVKDLPRWLSCEAAPIALDAKGPAIFAEIVDAPRLDVDAIVARAHALRRDGADVIDLGCLPQEPFPHLEDSVRALKAEGFAVSVDSMNPDELLRGGKAGADHLLSLTPDTAWIADEVASVPVLIAREPADEASLWSLVETFQRKGRAFLADSILDPIPFGFTASIVRCQRLRERFADAPIMIGTGNLSELTEADTSGMHALLLGIAAELHAAAILTTQVSAHARRAAREADAARRIMTAAVANRVLPKGLSDALMTVHAKHPFPDSDDEIAATAAQVRDPNFRVQISASGLHVYNRDGLRRASDPFALWPRLALEDDAAHAFYMGVETARAHIAWQLGKRYVQDQPLDWGVAVDAPQPNQDAWCAPGTTLTHRRAATALAPTEAGPDDGMNIDDGND
jgi:dihydropteroate synthase